MELKISRLERASFFGLLLFLVWVPIPLASNRTWALSILEFWSSLLCLIAVLCNSRQGLDELYNKLQPFRWIIIPVILFILWSCVQLLHFPLSWLKFISPNTFAIYHALDVKYATISLDIFATQQAVIKSIAYLMLIVSAALLINRVERLRMVLSVLVVSGVFQALYGAFEILLGETHSLVFGFPVDGASTGTFLYKNHFANYLMLCLCMSVGLIVGHLHASPAGSWLQRWLRWCEGLVSRKMFWRLAVIIMVIGLVMSRSRMGNAAFFSATMLGCVVGLLFYKDKPRAFIAFMVSILLIDTVIVGSLFGLNQLQEKMLHTSLATETRDEVVEWSLPLMGDFPLTGTGIGSYSSVFSSYNQWAIGYYDHAHNDYIEFAVEAGVPATLMLGAMCLWGIWLCLRVMKTHNSKTLKGTALGCFMAITGMLMHICVDFNLQAPANAATFLVILTLIGCLSSIRANRRLSGHLDV